MKSPALLAFFAASLGLCSAHATLLPADSAYANAFLYLTSSNSQENATANSTTNVGYADGLARPGFSVNSVLVSATAGGSSNSFRNEVVTGFLELLTIIDPALTGSAGTLSFNYEVNGDEVFDASSPADSSVTASASVGMAGGTDTLAFTEDSPGTLAAGTDFLGIPETVNVPFIFGKPFDLSLDIDTSALAEDLTAGSAMASGSFSTTSSIGNITAAGIASPLSASSVTVKQATGSDTLTFAAVPEPGGFMPAAAGAAALAFVVIRRRKLLRLA